MLRVLSVKWGGVAAPGLQPREKGQRGPLAAPGLPPMGWQELFDSCKASGMAPSIPGSLALPPGASGLPEGPRQSRLCTFPVLPGFLHPPSSPPPAASAHPFLITLRNSCPPPPLGHLHAALASAYRTSPGTAGRCHISSAPAGARGAASPMQLCIARVSLHRPHEFASPA